MFEFGKFIAITIENVKPFLDSNFYVERFFFYSHIPYIFFSLIFDCECWPKTELHVLVVMLVKIVHFNCVILVLIIQSI